MAPRIVPRHTRDALLEQHVGLVHHVARQLAGRLSTEAELDELVSAGTVGLLHAAESFDATRGLSFSTYAVPRIRGDMLDELRRQDPVSRNVRRRTRDAARARSLLANKLGRRPTDDEVSRTMGVSAHMVRQWELDAEGTAVRSLDYAAGDTSGVTLGDVIADDRAVSFEDLISHEQEVEHLKRAIVRLKDQERTVLALNFFEELKLQEIATVMGLSVCRISQIRTAALLRLKNALSYLRAA